MCERVEETASAVETPIGFMPTKDDLDLTGLDISEEDMAELLKVNPEEWKAEMPEVGEFLAKFGDKLPARMSAQLERLIERLG